MLETCAAVVVGAGPAGLAVVGNLLESEIGGRILWIDPTFQGGRISERYREVPSNTKVSLILSYAQALEPFRQVIENSSTPNAISSLENLDQATGCPLGYAADMFLMLTEGILRHSDKVEKVEGTVTEANLNSESSTWSIHIRGARSSNGFEVRSPCLILCTGSSPADCWVPVPSPITKQIDLDVALSRSLLESALPDEPGTTVAVIGTSHSAIIILMNLFDIANSTQSQLRVRWFARGPLKYAEYKDGWILRDNTGLKGFAASFARENLEDEKLKTSVVGKYIEKFDCSTNERSAYDSFLPGCTNIIQATGFTRDPIPDLTKDGSGLGGVIYDHKRGCFSDAEGRRLPGLYGAGIAFPELVTDPAGNTELAIGFWKFMRYLRKVVPEWVNN